TYYDTPDQALRRQSMALRVRQVGEAQWLQTLKTGGAAGGALSQRGEWEAPVPDGRLSRAMLAATPWAEWDADGALFAALQPLFTTRFERLSWVLELAGSRVEVALDLGQVEIDGHSTPLCELEIELLEGEPAALFDAAWHIGQQLSLLPLHMSKAERAYRLAAGTLDEPLRARPPLLTRQMALGSVVQSVLRESFLQFTANLYSLRASDAPEVLHQARVGWRRFKSGLQLFKQLGKRSGLPELAALKPLLAQMAQVRDLDVAASEVFPAFAASYRSLHAKRMAPWHRLEDALAQDLAQQRAVLRQLLCDPAVGRCLLLLTRWLELESALPGRHPARHAKHPAAHWLRQRIAKLAAQMQATAKGRLGPKAQHRLRIQSKRLRYGVESLRSLLPKKRAERWYHQATQLQTDIGLARDRLLAIRTAERLLAPPGMVLFLRDAVLHGGSAAL
ncbi:MAG: CHAD domain-containing protein, partial [Rhodoferax sp.]|nr:CHAD domain-containing protein [Rhodoferax sp.]